MSFLGLKSEVMAGIRNNINKNDHGYDPFKPLKGQLSKVNRVIPSTKEVDAFLFSMARYCNKCLEEDNQRALDAETMYQNGLGQAEEAWLEWDRQ